VQRPTPKSPAFQAKSRPVSNDFKMPGNLNRPNQNQIAKPNRPDVIRPGQKGGGAQLAGGGKLPDFGKKGSGNLPDFGKNDGGKLPDFGKKGAGKLPDFGKKDGKLPHLEKKGGKLRPNDGKLADLKKKNPGLFPDGKRPDRPNKKDDIADWLNPKNRPGDGIRPGTRPSKRPDNIAKDFGNNWKNAINTGKINIGNKRIGDINVDLSKNFNYNNIHNQRNVIQNNFQNNYRNNNYFGGGWWNRYPGGGWPNWHYHNYAGNWWRPATWGALTGFVASAAWSPPVYYDYGASYGGGSTVEYGGASPVYIDQDVVYVNDQPIASAPVYAEQAIELANVEPPPPEAKIEWMPLGTFAMMATKDDENPSVLLQLALSKDGLISGTWYNRETDKTSAVEGKVDPETQRVALRKPDEPDIVLECGVYNLTQDASSCLIHYGTLNTQTRWLARLEAPEQ
jgi:hypothetical protein